MGEDGVVHEIGFLDKVLEGLHWEEIVGKPEVEMGAFRCLLGVNLFHWT